MTAQQLFSKAIEGFTPGEIELVKEGRFCDSPKLRVARRYYLKLEMERMEDPSFLSMLFALQSQTLAVV